MRVAYKARKTMTDDTLIDHHGHPTGDPAVIYKEPVGAVMPMKRHKGSGLAMICSLLGGALSGGGTTQPGTSRERGIVSGMFYLTFDPARLIGADGLHADGMAFIEHVKASPAADPASPVLIAGWEAGPVPPFTTLG